MKVFIVDQSRCNGCYGCQIACKDEHVGNTWLPYAQSQPEIGHFWLKLNETTHGQIPKVRIEYKATLCQHCAKPTCIAEGDDTVYQREDGLVIIDPEKAKGRRDLLDTCPLNAIYWNEELSIAQKCTGCAHLIDAGELPRCVDFCSTGALRFGDEEDFVEDIARAKTRYSEMEPRVYYLNEPGLFIAGDVWDIEANEIIEDAVITLRAADGSTTATASDDLGDFWFNRLTPGNYTVDVAAEEYAPESREVHLDKSLNIGDFPLKKV